MEMYKTYMDGIKAPEELIEKTKKRMKEAAAYAAADEGDARVSETVPDNCAERSHAEGKPVSFRSRAFFGAALAACFVLFFISTAFFRTAVPAPAEDASFSLQDGSAELVWQPAADEVYRAADELTEQTVVSAKEDGRAEELSLPAAFEPSVLFPSYELVRETAAESSRVFFLRKEAAVIRYQVSASGTAVPEQLRKLSVQEYEGTALRLGISGDQRTCYIVRETDGLWLFLTAKDVSEESLKDILKKISEQV